MNLHTTKVASEPAADSENSKQIRTINFLSLSARFIRSSDPLISPFWAHQKVSSTFHYFSANCWWSLFFFSEPLSTKSKEKELYREAAAHLLAMSCEFTENCRCLDCQVSDDRRFCLRNQKIIAIYHILFCSTESLFRLWWWRVWYIFQ